jgi:hypothetical protein
MIFFYVFIILQNLWSYTCKSDQSVTVENKFCVKSSNLPSQTLISWNGLTVVHYVAPFHNTLVCVQACMETLKSGVADYVIFLITSDIIFWWLWYICSNDQNLSWTWLFSKRKKNLPPQTLMSCNCLDLAHYVGCITKLTLMSLPGGGLPNIMGRGLTVP